jgi:hypothetical protein
MGLKGSSLAYKISHRATFWNHLNAVDIYTTYKGQSENKFTGHIA